MEEPEVKNLVRDLWRTHGRALEPALHYPSLGITSGGERQRSSFALRSGRKGGVLAVRGGSGLGTRLVRAALASRTSESAGRPACPPSA